MRVIPPRIDSGVPELDQAWKKHASAIVARPGVVIPDTEEDLNWHAFLGHGFDMQGFRAAEFVGVDAGPAGFQPLRARGVGVAELAALWHVEPIRAHLLGASRSTGIPMGATYRALREHGGSAGRELAEALEAFRFRKTHRTVRALLQDSAVLDATHGSFRAWLERSCAALGAHAFPPTDFQQPATDGRPLEMALRQQIEAGFYLIGPALAAYMLCDWQLGLWLDERTAVFRSFKLDSFHQQFTERFGRGVIPPDEAGFARWWLGQVPDLPPRLANECIWLATENRLFASEHGRR